MLPQNVWIKDDCVWENACVQIQAGFSTRHPYNNIESAGKAI